MINLSAVTISNIRPIIVRLTKDSNGNSVYTATCGSLRKRHLYDPSMTRDDNVRAAALLCCFDPHDRLTGSASADGNTWTFSHVGA